MSVFMNRYDVEDALEDWTARHEDGHEVALTLSLAEAVHALMRWTDSHSDGWAYWPKPSRAAGKATDLLRKQSDDYRRDGCETRWNEATGRHEVIQFRDLTEAEVRKALAPIKSFLTRQGVPHDNVLNPYT